MRRFRAAGVVALFLIICVFLVAYAADQIVIDVVNGNFRSGQYDIPLADVETPITISMQNGDVILHITTTFGVMELNMGPGRVALTERASSYAKVSRGTAATPSGTGAFLQPQGTGPCPVCGEPLSEGDHRQLACGHYACLVGANHLQRCPHCGEFLCRSTDIDHTPCPRCGVGVCAHDDFACDYFRNPAPTPFVTTDPNGNTVYYYTDVDGAYVLGYATSKPWSWQPGVDFGKRIPTPEPSVTPIP